MAVALPAVDYREFTKRAIIAGLVTLVLASLLVGIETVSTVNGLEVATRYRAVFFASAGVAVVYFLIEMLKAGRTLAPLVVGLVMIVAFAVLEWAQAEGLPLGDQLPFNSWVVNWGVMLVPVSLVLRSLYLMFKPEVTVARGKVDSREHGFTRFYLRYNKLFGFILIACAVALPFMPFADRRLIDVGTLVLTYVMLGWGLNIVVGLAGLLDLGYVAFYAVGAYAYALLSTQQGLGFWAVLPMAGALAASFGVLLGFPVLRLRGDYLAIVTLGFGEIIRLVILNWVDLTNGPAGIGSIPGPTLLGALFAETAPEGKQTVAELLGIPFDSNQRLIFLYYVILALALVTNLFAQRMRRLPVGRAWEALREDETACKALGINPTNTKLTAFAVGAMFAGFAGSFFAAKQRFISPESFTFIESAIILAIVVLGGMGSQIGVVLAAVLLIGLPEWFRDLGTYRMLAFGLAMVLIMVFRPRGLIAHRAPSVRLHPIGAKGAG